MQELFSNATQIPTIPKVVQDVMEAFRSDTVTADFLAETLAQDPAMTAKVLRMANSAHFGGSRNIASCADAVVLLGMDALKTLVLASGVTGAFDFPESINRKQFWGESFDAASIAKWLALHSNSADKETAFTCGMLHQIGRILIAMNAPEQAAKIDQAVANGASRTDLEKETLGYTSNEVSAELAKRWRFPEAMVNALSQQDNELPDNDLAALLFVTKYLLNGRKDPDQRLALVESFPLPQASTAGIDSASVLADIDELYELKSDLADLID